jgi:[ribosomal protein S5]-alanine N-acetyltransferase
MIVLETERLRLRWLTLGDAPFIFELVNDPSFIRFIGDKGVRTIEDAEKYISNGPVASYEKFGYGLYATELRDNSALIGICGILKRDTLPHPDIGFAFLPAYWNLGYACEAAEAVMRHARAAFNIDTILAITTPNNEASGKLLGKIGLTFDRMIKLTPESDEVKLFTTTENGKHQE